MDIIKFMQNFLVKSLIIASLLGLGSCKWFTRAHLTFPAFTGIKIPKGTPAFRTGFEDGCSTALYARGNVFYRTKYDYRYDPKMIGNTEYHFGHRRGYSWCFLVALAPINKSFDAYIEDPPFDMSAGNISNNWDGFFSGPLGGKITSGTTIDDVFGIWSKNKHGQSALGTYPLWAGNSVGQFFGQKYKGTD